MSRITGFETADVRFPTSAELDGSDAMNPDPDYSAAYVVVETDAGDAGHGFAFTIGRGNEVQVAAIDSLRDRYLGRDADELLADMGAAWRELVHDSQLRWLGPEKGVMHMAAGAVVNALWDLKAKRAGLPLWELLASMSPEELVALVDFRYLTDALSREAVEQGFELIKLKVGGDLADDERRLRIAREAVGPDVRIAVDANQNWEVEEAIEWMRALAPHDIAWIEEPTNPDDVLGHAAIARGVAPIPVATGEHMANRVMAKQFLQSGALQVLQIDATRVAGVNENVAMLLLAARFGVPVCPHAGGVGLCEAVQHLAMFDFVAVSGSLEGRVIEFVDHLHEHFAVPAEVRRGRYVAPTAPGAGMEMLTESVAAQAV